MKRVLIVDDIEGWREFNSKIILELLGSDTEIVKASSAEEAYTRILESNANPFDIIITDLQMENKYEPKYAGEWLIEQIKNLKNYCGTKIVIISSAYNIRYIAEQFSAEALPKPTALKCLSAYKEVLGIFE